MNDGGHLIKKIKRRIISGFTILGLGIGMIFGKPVAGCLIGLGIGLLVSSFVYCIDIKLNKSLS
ncbi:hypothetical protein Metvu_0177 [Methanocaldococcus vulcanius M7]|uniref:Uncharacterized protein n=1 Tax=Methanocaldococcus vulcanius (strain ATCC 700851 / DSM 12094 / M7) TaxID=579137 RepID=C9REP2_METVM|nr:hypothetical protein [Methanocaldococcus vulcanius]ACX72044.1 hypothetical protein Metvu_0177 [Methanocaldococcus vulcanius M7]